MFGLCLASACVRYYIRLYIQRQFSIDDGILLLGIACLVVAVVLLFRFIDEMYLVGALQEGTPDISLPSDFISQAFDFDKLSTVTNVLTWCSLISVKFSYLFFFKKLIDRIRPMMIYWWVTAVFNGIVSVYVAALYGAVCPYYHSTKACKSTGSIAITMLTEPVANILKFNAHTERVWTGPLVLPSANLRSIQLGT